MNGYVEIGSETTETAYCPKCGERRIDWLAWTENEEQDDEFITCQTCGYIYEADWLEQAKALEAK